MGYPSLWQYKGRYVYLRLDRYPQFGVEMKLSASQVKSAKPAEKSYKLSDGRGVKLINRGS